MPKGSVEPFNLSLKKFKKATNAAIPLGTVCVRDESLTPDGWKAAGAAATGPFVVAVVDLAEVTDAYFTGAQAPSEVMCECGVGGLQPGAPVKTDASGNVVLADVTSTTPDDEMTIVGKYLGLEGVSTSDAAVATNIVRIKLQGVA